MADENYTRRIAHLTQANDVRHAHALAKRALGDGTLGLADAMRDPALARLPLRRALAALPYVGPAKSARIELRATGTAAVRLGSLTDRHRARVLTALADLAPTAYDFTTTTTKGTTR